MSNPLLNLIGSKFLALGALILFCSSLATVISCLLPFWFRLKMQLTFVEDQRPIVLQTSVSREINCGLYFMDEKRFINTLMLDKADNTHFMPPILRVSQLLYLLGSISVLVCCGSSFILGMRRYASTTGEMFLAAATMPSALCQVLAIILILVQVLFYPNSEWQRMPVEDYIPNRFTYYTVVSAYPDVSLNWGFYVGCVAAAFSLAASVILWMQACFTYCHFSRVRYNMLRQKPDTGSSPIPGKGSYQNPGFLRTSPQEYPAIVPSLPGPTYDPGPTYNRGPTTAYEPGMELDL